MSAEHDRELQGYLDGGSPLSAKYRQQSNEAAPPELDAAVLGFAREQIRSAPATHSVVQRGYHVRRRRWAIPLATAATMLLGFNLVWQLRDQALPQSEQAVASAPQARSTAASASAPAPAAKAKRSADAPRELASEADVDRRAAAKPAAPPAAAVRDQDLSAPAADALTAAMAEAPVAQAPAELAAKEEAVQMQAARVASREASRQRAARSDSAKLQRERSYGAAGSFAAAPAPAPAYTPLPPASEVTGQVMDWLRKGDFAAIRAQLQAGDVDQQRLDAAAAVARTIDPTVEPAFSSVGEDLWRVDYVEQAQRCTMMLQRTPAGWRLLSVEVGGD